jgi:hypothetical protein
VVQKDLVSIIMQRRVRHNSNGSTTTALPLRVTKDEYAHHTRNTRPARRTLPNTVIVAVISITMLVGFILTSTSSRTNSSQKGVVGGSRHLERSKFYDQRPLDKFSELKYALEHSKLVLLYFAASWCPMSTPISEALDAAFGKGDMNMLLTRNGKKKTLSIVYVSSDETLEEYEEYTCKRHWLPIPFDSPEKNELKRHFATCAHRELEELLIDRKHEIPTGIVIDSRTQGIITTNGADDVEVMGADALEHWLKMQEWASQMANSIAHINDGISQIE